MQRREKGRGLDRRWWIAGVALAIAAAGSLALAPAVREWSPFTPGKLTKVRAAAESAPFRIIEGRLTGGFPHRPWRGRTRGALDFQQTRYALLAAVSGVPDARPGQGARADAAAWLLAGEAGHSVGQLESLLPGTAESADVSDRIQRCGDAGLLTDLAAAYLASAADGRDPDHELYAVAAAARAYELAPRSPEAVWNRALATEAIGLVEEARRAWQESIALDAGSKWSDEARERMASLPARSAADLWRTAAAELSASDDAAVVERIAARFPVRTRSLVEQEWLPRWAVAATNRQSTASTLLTLIEGAARGMVTGGGDRQLLDFVDAARSSGDMVEFSRAHLPLGLAREALRERGTPEAIAILEPAVAGLTRVGSPMAAAARVELAGHLYHASRHDRALAVLDETVPLIDERKWPLLAARYWWNRGVALASIGQLGPAGGAYQRSVDAYLRAGDLTHVGMLQMLIAHNAETVRDLPAVWPRYAEALRMALRHGDPERVLVILDTFCRAALRAGHHGAAAVLNDALIARIDARENRPYLCHALITRCDIEARRGDLAGARAQCREARQVFSSISDGAVRDRLEADLEISAAMVAGAEQRLERLGRAVDVSEARHDIFRLARVLLLRGRAWADAGELRRAREDFGRSLAAIEQQRGQLERVPDRLTYFETSRETASELVRLLVHTGEEEEALRVVERVRARSLLEQMAAAVPVPDLTLDEVRARLDPKRAIVEYWADERELYVWTIRGDGIAFVRHPAAKRNIERAARRFANLLAPGSGSEADARRAAGVLYQQLLLPVAKSLGGIETLTIVPDAVIAEIPLAALFDEGRGLYLVQSFALTQAPSARAFVAGHAVERRHESIMIVANPDLGETLPALDVSEEISSARRHAWNTSLFTGAEASARVIRDHAGAHDVLHIATHAFDDSQAGEPVLLLTPASAGDDGYLSASDVERDLTVRSGSLVVLAACRTARGRHLSEGTMSMARAFIAAGAGSVVASLWDADDADSGRMFEEFYAALGSGATPAAALRTAQISLLANETHVHPRRWAAYQIYGGA